MTGRSVLNGVEKSKGEWKQEGGVGGRMYRLGLSEGRKGQERFVRIRRGKGEKCCE